MAQHTRPPGPGLPLRTHGLPGAPFIPQCVQVSRRSMLAPAPVFAMLFHTLLPLIFWAFEPSVRAPPQPRACKSGLRARSRCSPMAAGHPGFGSHSVGYPLDFTVRRDLGRSLAQSAWCIKWMDDGRSFWLAAQHPCGRVTGSLCLTLLGADSSFSLPFPCSFFFSCTMYSVDIY